MKKRAIAVSILSVLFLLAAATPGQAQQPLRVKIPFAFVADKVALPAGEYLVQPARDGSPAMIVQRIDVRAGSAAILMTNAAQANDWKSQSSPPPSNCKLTGRWHSLDPRTSSGWPSIRRAKATPSAAFLSPLMTYGSAILRSCPKKSTPFASMRHAPEVPKKLLKGKIALVAGATRGAGRGIAIALGAADVGKVFRPTSSRN